jgi:hypothetical protein
MRIESRIAGISVLNLAKNRIIPSGNRQTVAA